MKCGPVSLKNCLKRVWVLLDILIFLLSIHIMLVTLYLYGHCLYVRAHLSCILKVITRSIILLRGKTSTVDWLGFEVQSAVLCCSINSGLGAEQMDCTSFLLPRGGHFCHGRTLWPRKIYENDLEGIWKEETVI